MTILQQLGAAAVLPEIVLAILAMVLLMEGVFVKAHTPGTIRWGAIASLVAVGLLVLWKSGSGAVTAFDGALVVDSFARFMKVLALIGAAVTLAMSGRYLARNKMDSEEYPVLVMLATVGMMLMISANDLISLYVGLELQSLALYVVAAINRDSAKSSEAGLKYFVLGALSSGMLLYGASLIYGFTGHTGFTEIAAELTKSGPNLGVIFGIVFIMAGLSFKVSAVPFHMWTPDVYEGAPTPVTAFFASAPKVAAIALFARTMVGPFAHITDQWQQVAVFVSVASMALGAFAAIGQTNIKRLMAYSSIGNMGFALVGLAAGTPEGVQGLIVYMLIYMATTLGTFACILAMKRKGIYVEQISDLAGLSRRDKGLAFIFAMLMFSLAGVPPLAGFFGKLFVFMAAVKAGLYVFAVLGVIASVVGAYYYLRIVKIIYFDEPAEAFDGAAPEIAVVAYASCVFVLGFIIFAHPLITLAAGAAKSLF
ncbi:NADH-quinone oxidoreductase subunit NuoN [Aestuariivirga litoralis]|uniref:NADH-quinone oxidoreductase subunit NuoN n=1 Tax=Aestuariivirga litoralis TaxID=2650924 RepID=UPI0018C75DF6|nr:NADH-quinone oxidoreductase subunit NuoN [Aestuariivirga litoralis]MBG1231833.1 NADH-quinone oxidoreductase subunit NuoN [Aestuariivirga litoralis]